MDYAHFNVGDRLVWIWDGSPDRDITNAVVVHAQQERNLIRVRYNCRELRTIEHWFDGDYHNSRSCWVLAEPVNPIEVY